MTFSHALSTNNYGPAKFIVDANAANGTHTTITLALLSASAGDTIFIRPGTYTENLTLKAGVDLTSFSCDSFDGHVTIIGKATMTTAGTVNISNIRLQTNSDFLLAVTGTLNSIVNLLYCDVNCVNNTGISYTTSGASSAIRLRHCIGDIGTTGIALFASTGANFIMLEYTDIGNSGSSVTASTMSAGVFYLAWSQLLNPITTSATAGFSAIDSTISVSNTTNLTAGGSGGHTAYLSSFSSGTASTISVGNNLTLSLSSINSSNTNAITGAGTLAYSGLVFTGSSSLINTTTQTGGLLLGGTAQAPSIGYIGEQIRATGSVTPATGVSTNICSIALTAGIWDISAVAQFEYTGITSVSYFCINTTSASFAGIAVVGDNYLINNFTITSGNIGVTIPTYRLVTTAASTTVYAVCQPVFSTGSATVLGRISATREG